MTVLCVCRIAQDMQTVFPIERYRDLNSIISGVYSIVCKSNGRAYVGSTKNLKKRISQHYSALNKRVHYSILLQRSFDKYGLQDFEVRLLEECLNSDILTEREAFHINSLKACDPLHGFNNKLDGKRPTITEKGKEIIRFKKSKDYHFQKDEIVYKGRNIHAFAKEHSVSSSGLYDVLHGRRQACKGFHLPGVKLPSPYRIMDPNGKIYEFKSIRKFAKLKGLDHRSLAFVLSRHKKYNHTSGWHLPEIVLPTPKAHRVISPDGVLYEFTNISKFARDHKLCASNLTNVLNRKNGYKTIKKWKLAECY